MGRRLKWARRQLSQFDPPLLSFLQHQRLVLLSKIEGLPCLWQPTMTTLTFRPQQSSEDVDLVFTAETSDELRSALQSISNALQHPEATNTGVSTGSQGPALKIVLSDIDEESVGIWLEGVATIEGIVCELEITTTVLSGPARTQSLDQLLRSLSNSPILSKFKINSDFNGMVDNIACMRAVSTVLARARNLVSFQCSIHMFEGTSAVFETFAAGFLNHPTLVSVLFNGCAVSHECDKASNSNLLLSALATIPKLRSLGLSPGCLPPIARSSPSELEPLLALCALPNLRDFFLLPSFVVDGCAPEQRAPVLGTILPSLRRKNKLQFLSVGTSLQKEECAAIGELIGQANLRYVAVGINNSGQDSHVQLVTEALQQTQQSLTSLTFYFYSGTPFFSDGIQQGLISMLRDSNTTLTTINISAFDDPDLPAKHHDFFQTVALYTKLNRLGRKALLAGPDVSNHTWIDFLAKSRNDVEVIFYALSLKPDLCA